MADNEIIGRTSCPVCGCADQDIKINKNNKLYMFCDNGCAIKWNSAQSRKYLPLLKSGAAVRTETGLILQSIKELEKNEQQQTNFENSPGRYVAGSRGNYAGGRPDRGFAGTAAAGDNGSGERRGWLAGLLSDDDDE